jgi:ABC-type phosphonate transport system ATPase subunit
MAVLIQNPTKCEVQAVIRFLHMKVETAAEIHHQFVSVYSEDVMNRQNVAKWCREFEAGRSDVRPPLWSSGQSSWLQIQRSRVRFPTLPDFF